MPRAQRIATSDSPAVIRIAVGPNRHPADWPIAVALIAVLSSGGFMCHRLYAEFGMTPVGFRLFVFVCSLAYCAMGGLALFSMA
ncbi:MAG TPA: hypothetical protein VIF09_00370 [Polyangiaceae bacterium]